MADIMTLSEVANYLRVTEKTIYRLLKRNSIPATKIGGQWRFQKNSVDEWIEQSSVGERATILVVDDEETIRALFKETIEDLGHEVIVAANAYAGLDVVKKRDVDLVFLDLKMPGMDGAEAFHRIKLAKPKLPVVIITGYPESDIMARALAYGPFAVMNKPFSESDIILAVDNFLRITRQQR